MRKLLILICLLVPLLSNAQQFYTGPYYNYYNQLAIGRGTSSAPNANAWLQLGDAGRPAKAAVWFVPINRNLVASPQIGMLVCDVSDGHFYRWDGTQWVDISSTFAESDPVATAKTITINAGTGISITGAAQTIGNNPTFTVVNTAPDQIVTITGQGGISVTGPYPNFTITGTGGGDGNNYPTSLVFTTTTGDLTLGRFGMTDLVVNLDGRYIENEGDPVWSSVSANYYTKTNLQTSGQATIHWGNITNAPSFITENQTITLSGDVTGSGKTAITTTIPPNTVTYAKMQDVTGTRLLGRYSNAAGDPQEITLGSGLSLNPSTGVLSNTGVTEVDPIWTAASGNYYTKTNLQTSGQAAVHWGNITNVPGSFPTNSNLQTVLNNGNSAVNIGAFINGGTIATPFAAQSSRPLDNGSYSNSHFVAEVTGSGYTSGARPSIGFHAIGNFGSTLYLNSTFDTRLRANTGVEAILWNSMNDGSGTGLDADLLDGLHANEIVGNWGQQTPHSGVADFNAITKFGGTFINGVGGLPTNNPGNGDIQYYSWAYGLGSEYSIGSYNLQFSMGRPGGGGTDNGPYLFRRFNENATYTAWEKIWAGNADAVDRVSSERIVWGTNETATLSYSSSDLNTILKSGFYDGSAMTGAPDATNWWTVMNIRHSNPASDYGTQLAQRFTGNSPNQTSVALYARTKYNGAYGTWAEVYNSDSRPQIMYEWKPFIGSGNGFLADDMLTNTTTFAYTEAGTPDGAAGPLMGFGGFNRGGYPMQIFGNYAQSQGRFYARVRNGDNNTWNPWRELWHTGNLTPSINVVGNTVVQRDANGYINTNYLNSTDNSQPNGVTGIMVKAGDNYLRTGTASAIRDFLGLGNGGSFIWNQNTGLQTGDFYISGRGTIGGGGSTGSISILNGGNTNQGYIEFRYPSATEGGRGTRQGYIGYGTNGMQYVDETGNGHMFIMSVGGSNMRVGGMYGVGTSGFKSYGYGGLIGDYDQNGSASKIIWTIGDAWNSLGTFYGLGYEYADPPGSLGPDHSITLALAGTINRRMYLNGNDHLNHIEATGQIRAGGWYNGFGDGPAVEMGVAGEGYIVGYDRTNSNYINLNIEANKLLLTSTGEESRTFGSNIGNLTYGSWFLTGFRNGWTGLSFPSAPGVPTWMFDAAGASANGGLYYQSHGAWALYYNGGTGNWHIGNPSSNIVLHTGNHPPGVATTTSSNFYEAISFISTNSAGHVTSVGKKSFESIIPQLTSGTITPATNCIVPNAFWSTSGCSLQPMNAVFKQTYGGAGVVTVQSAIIVQAGFFGDYTRRVIATLPAGYAPILPIKWSAGTFISTDYCYNGQVSGSEYNTEYIQLTITTTGDIVCETGGTFIFALFGGQQYKVIPIQITYVVSSAA